MLDSGANLLHYMDLNIDVIIKKYIYGAQNNKTYIFFKFLFSGTTKNNNANICNSACDLEEVTSKDSKSPPGYMFQ